MITLLIITGITAATVAAAWWDFRAYRLWYRAGLIALSGALLLGFWVNPKWGSVSSTARVAVLTDGYREQSDFKPGDYETVFSLVETDRNSSHRKWLSSITLLHRFLPEGSEIDIWGTGTGESLSEKFTWSNRLSSPQKGLLLQRAPHQVETGKLFELSLQALNSGAEDTLRVFKDGRMLLAESISDDGGIMIEDRLSSEGPAHYRFEWTAGDSLITEQWNVRGMHPPRLHVGILLYSPSFEVTHLANQLGERGHRILQRTRLGQERFRYDAYHAETSENILSHVKEFDLLILDAREFPQLSAPQRQEIGLAVESGLDLLLLSPSPDGADGWAEVFSELSATTIQLEEIDRLEERLWVPDQAAEIPLLNLNFSTVPNEGEVLFSYVDGNPVSVRMPRQGGSVTGHLFYGTHTRLLKGEENAYRRFWRDYLGELISMEGSLVETATAIPKIHSQLRVILSGGVLPDSIHISSVVNREALSLPVVRGLHHPETGETQFWPKDEGWHRVQAGDQMQWFYVYGEADWNTDQQYRAWQFTENQLKHREEKEPGEERHHPLPAWVWLIGFLVVQSVLWAERKVAG